MLPGRSVARTGGAALVSVAAAASVAAGAPDRSPPHTVTCSEIIGQARSGHDAGYRVVLGVVSVPPAYLPQVTRTDEHAWPYGTKAGLVLHATTAAVVVSVPTAWRHRLAITWGNRPGAFASLRFEPCASPPSQTWNAYAGGILLRSRRACVPLVVTVASRRAEVWFGLGRRCAARLVRR